jgi:hypothetical protein
MMNKGLITFSLLLLLLASPACREPFDIELREGDSSVLVVEGFVEVDGQESLVSLSRTAPLGRDESVLPVENALVYLEGEDEKTWDFKEASPGQYFLEEVLDPSQKYRLKIKLSGNEYESEFLTAHTSPEIEEVGFNQDEKGVSIYVNTQGGSDATYFIWDFEETWTFRSSIVSSYIYNHDRKWVFMRTPAERTDVCWRDEKSKGIIMESSHRYLGDFIFQKEVQRIPLRSEKLGRRYSIEVKQRVVDKQAFDFWEIMKKNSDDLSGIFSPLPSILRSNIRNVKDPAENVIGYISMGKSSRKRFFISNKEIHPWQISIADYDHCRPNNDTIPPHMYANTFASGGMVPVDAITRGPAVIGYTAAVRTCTDCTLRGTRKRPEFWVDDF